MPTEKKQKKLGSQRLPSIIPPTILFSRNQIQVRDTNSFIQQMFIDCLLCAKHYTQSWSEDKEHKLRRTGRYNWTGVISITKKELIIRMDLN